ncbi:FtsW/RodA/SpoVE family cell cycle protein [Lacticaseibacillus brantae]|uniref:Probable peptidoglycan glycosyltransferase FtsW n=1 Tax=Lacticaseibacillus brantae DSM 23927 TaxID=1423727 RepID=A0A0R2B3L9_9LACO|nr:FtsW/RodA/SpoVE family cell cycle protein [Lacticaseibacillus brantae]KRM72548.1 cell division membrane protein [Lacticaseibacillus brantae DSM 23927]
MKKRHYLDFYILVPTLILMAIGLVMVYSASSYWIVNMYHWSETAVLVKQGIFAVLGAILVVVFFHLRIRVLRNKWFLLVSVLVTIGLLALLMVKGHLDPSSAVNGASSWIPIGPFNLQPSEFAKLVIILFLANLLTNRQDQLATWTRSDLAHQWVSLLFVLAIIGLVFLQPDTGGAAILLLITLVMIASSGISVRIGLEMTLGTGAIVGAGYYFLTHTTIKGFEKYYQYRRILAVAHPFAWQAKEGNQIVNSLYAINHGGFFGVGLGMSSQKLGYIPEPYTDMILAIIAEELGFIGAALVVGLLFFLIMRFYLIGIRSRDAYHSLLAYGIATMLLVQTFFNVGAVLGLIPITGVTLPLISYGGSSLFVVAIAIGIMLNISASERKQKESQLN